MPSNYYGYKCTKALRLEKQTSNRYNMVMNKWLVWAGSVIAGIAVGLIVASKLSEKSILLCPACGRRLIVGEDWAVCKSCGKSIPL